MLKQDISKRKKLQRLAAKIIYHNFNCKIIFFLTIKAEDIDEKLKEINNLHPNLKFTIKLEKDGKIPFLDMFLIRKENCVESTWYYKPTDTGLVMNLQALAPKRYKRGVVSGFVHRIYRACSTWENLFSY